MSSAKMVAIVTRGRCVNTDCANIIAGKPSLARRLHKTTVQQTNIVDTHVVPVVVVWQAHPYSILTHWGLDKMATFLQPGFWFFFQ